MLLVLGSSLGGDSSEPRRRTVDADVNAARTLASGRLVGSSVRE
jgi:hypothetical protein